MRHYLPVVILLALTGGCTKTDSPTVVSPTNSASLPTEKPTESTKPTTYPEKTEVERLLVRAGEFQQQGEFEKALTLVKEALQVDPNSPSATVLRTSLEDIMRKI